MVLDNINTVEKSDDGSDDADAVAQQHCAVIQTQQRRVQDWKYSIVEIWESNLNMCPTMFTLIKPIISL